MSNENPIKDSIRLEDPRMTFDRLVCPEYVIDAINELLDEEPYAKALEREGITPKRMILLAGPSGCGKTSIAHALASATKMKLAVAPVSQSRGSYLGESEKRMEYVMKIGNMNRCVLLIDEFDSVASARGNADNAAMVDRNNVVNVLLQEMESHPPKGYLVACTNHLELLDPAVLRRFDLILEIPMIDRDALLEVAKKVLRGRFDIKPEDAVLEDTSPAIVTKRAESLLRREIIKREKELDKKTKEEMVAENKRMVAQLSKDFPGINVQEALPY